MDHTEALKHLQTLINVASKAEPCVAHRILREMVGVINNVEPPKGPDLDALKRPSHLRSIK